MARGFRFGGILILFSHLILSTHALAAKKDFKGLFGSYRREKFTENEGREFDFGVDLMLSTLIPISPIVSGTTDRSVAASPLPSSDFFNVEASFFFSFWYNWEIFLSSGYYSFNTRQQIATNPNPSLPIFQQFEMDTIPVILGIKYRFGADDIVPYIGVGAGISRVHRIASYDYQPIQDESTQTVLTAEAIVGLEFYFSSRAGFRLETSAYYLAVPGGSYDPTAPSGNAALSPIFVYQQNPILLRYASGLFFLF
jgi:hypothetical protein